MLIEKALGSVARNQSSECGRLCGSLEVWVMEAWMKPGYHRPNRILLTVRTFDKTRISKIFELGKRIEKGIL